MSEESTLARGDRAARAGTAGDSLSAFLPVLVESSSTPNLPQAPQTWEAGLRRLRRGALLSRLAAVLSETGAGPVPQKPAAHLTAATALAEHHRRTLWWELDRIGAALSGVNAPVVLLKGAAYALAGLPPARGRLASDVDILVPRDTLSAVEAALRTAGWEPVKRDPYDQRYYRRWMHELPPLRHVMRGTTVDVHHSILPPTSRCKPDPQRLFEDAVRVDGSDLLVLAPVDMVLHSAAHLFHDGDLALGLRDLIDIHDLLRFFGAGADFWERLVPRAHALDLQRPLFYALRYCESCLGSMVPTAVSTAIGRDAPARPVLALMDRLVVRALVPRDHGSRADFSQWLLYVRAHYLRMPLYLLVPHLLRKAATAWRRDETIAEENV